MRWYFVGLWLLLPFGARGAYVIPYELRIGQPPERYTVLVVLADHYARHFGEPDGMTGQMIGNFHPNPRAFLADYLKLPYSWYLGQLEKHPKIYGEHVDEIVRGLSEFESIGLGRTSAIIVTEYRKLERVLSFLRIDTSDEKGLLSSEAHFLNRGLGGERFPAFPLEFKWNLISDFAPVSYLEGFHRVSLPPSERMHYWLEGENVEFKNFAMDPETGRKFFKYLYLIARDHKMFSWGAGLFPSEITHWPDGRLLPSDAHTRFGRRVSHVWLDAYTAIMARYYGGMGFRIWRRINNEHTQHRDLYFMVAPVRDLERSVRAQVERADNQNNSWIKVDTELSPLISRFTCRLALEKAAALGAP